MKSHAPLLLGATLESLIVTTLLKKKLSSQQLPHFKLTSKRHDSFVASYLRECVSYEEVKLNVVLIASHIFWRWLKFHSYRFCRENFITDEATNTVYAFCCTVMFISFAETVLVRFWMEYYLLMKRMRVKSDSGMISSRGLLSSAKDHSVRLYRTLEFFVTSILIFTVKQMVFNGIFFALILNFQPQGKEHWFAQFVLGSVAASIGSLANNGLDVYWLRYNEYHLGESDGGKPGAPQVSWTDFVKREMFLGYGWKLLRIALGNGIMALSLLLSED